jgi:hypothetical protein
MKCNGQRGNQHQGGLNRTPVQTVGGFQQTHTGQNCCWWEGQGKKYPARQGKGSAEHKKQSETTYICKFCIVPLHKGSCFERYHSPSNYWNLYVQFLPYWVQEFHLYCQMVTKNPFRCFTFKVCKTSENRGYLIKGAPRRQCVNYGQCKSTARE